MALPPPPRPPPPPPPPKKKQKIKQTFSLDKDQQNLFLQTSNIGYGRQTCEGSLLNSLWPILYLGVICFRPEIQRFFCKKQQPNTQTSRQEIHSVSYSLAEITQNVLRERSLL